MKKQYSTLFAILILTLSVFVYAGDLRDGWEAFQIREFNTAFKKWNPFAEADADAQYVIGDKYFSGRLGADQDFKIAAKWYRLAAEQGNAKAQDSLGLIYRNGLGVTRDYKESVRWSKLAAEQGQAYSQGRLGLMFAKGQGVVQDFTQAYKWHSIAVANGDKLAEMDRNNLEKQMTPDQISEAKKLAREWMKEHSTK